MKLWRLVRAEHQALDGKGAFRLGGRYSSPGYPLVSFASESGLAVLVAFRYWQADPQRDAFEYVLGWTKAIGLPERVPSELSDDAKKMWVDEWAAECRTLLIAIQSAVLPEADVILMNPLHQEATSVAPLTARPFSFETCLHRPPMLERFGKPQE